MTKKNGTAIAVKQSNQIKEVRDLFVRAKNQIKNALPKHMDPDRMIRIALTTIQRTPRLLECDQRSLLGALVESSQLGLEIDGILGQAYLVPYSKNGGYIAQLIPGYRGLINLARRSGQVMDLYAEVVWSEEEVELDFGIDRRITHKPKPPSKRGREVVGAYAVAAFKDGSKSWRWMYSEEIEAIRDRSQGWRAYKAGKIKENPWSSDPVEMYKKTVIRALAKYLPLSPEFNRAAEMMDAPGHETIHLEDNEIIDVDSEILEEKAKESTEELKTKLNKGDEKK